MIENRKQTRRKWLGACAGITGASALAGCFGSGDDTGSDDTGDENGENGKNGDTQSGDWPRYGVDRQNTSHHPSATGPKGDELTKRAVADIDSLSTYPAAISDGALYVSTTAETVYAVDLESEEILWEKGGYGSPTVHDGTVYGPTDGGYLYSYDTETGDRWKSTEIDSVIGLGEPVPTSNGIFVASHEIIWQIDPDTGEYTEVVDTPAFVGGSTDHPAFRGNILYIARSSELHAVNVETSEIEWTFETADEGIVIDSNPAVGEKRVYVGNRDRELHAIDIDSGEEEWTIDTVSSVETSPAIVDGVVYLAERGRVIAVDGNTGGLEWDVDDAVGGTPEDIVVADGKCYFTARSGIQVFDADSGELAWEYEVDDLTDGGFTAPATIFDGAVYLPANDDTLYAIEDA